MIELAIRLNETGEGRLRQGLRALRVVIVVAAALVMQSSACTPAPLYGSVAGVRIVEHRRVLNISIYPYVPDAVGVVYAIKEAFEKENPGIALNLSMNDYYYDQRPEKGGILFETADVYEMDSVFFADFVNTGKIQPLPETLVHTVDSMIPVARDAAKRNGISYGVPHWVCGNFMIYRAGDFTIERARNLRDLELGFGNAPGLQQGLLLDLKGKSTLGEMYLDSLMDHYGSPEMALSHVDPLQPPDSYVEAAMRRALALEAAGFGRDSDYHDATGFYARQFARGDGRALVGYSELLFYALSESAQSCRKEDNCIKQSDIRVTDWPLADEGSHPVAWVDMFVIDSKVSGQKLVDAEKFIQFMVRKDTYKMLLIPGYGEAPRYLLPAREDVYGDPDIQRSAPLYSAFRQHFDSADPITDIGLNQRLREIGAKIDADLPPH